MATDDIMNIIIKLEDQKEQMHTYIDIIEKTVDKINNHKVNTDLTQLRTLIEQDLNTLEEGDAEE